jgi:diguanylate cyclase (GGDEF)-like protein
MTRQNTTARVFSLLPLCLLLLLAGCAGYGDSSRPLNTVEKVRQAALKSQNYGRPVQLQATVTYYDPEWHLLFLQDSTAGLFVSIPEPVSGLSSGQLVEVQGTLATSNIGVENLRVQMRGPTSMPAAKPFPWGQDPQDLHIPQWVEVRGIVRYSGIEDGRLTLTIADGANRTRVRFLDSHKAWPVSLLGASVSVRGVAAADADIKGDINGIQMFATAYSDLKANGKLKSPYDLQPITLAEALHSRKPGELVHLAGTVVSQSPDRVLSVSDGTLAVKVLLADSSQFAPGDGVEMLGFTTANPDHQVEDAVVRLTAPRKPLDEAHLKGTLRKLRELKRLSVESAAHRLPLDVRGTVTFIDQSLSLLFVQDDTAGVYVDIHDQIANLRPGDLVHVTGVSAPGEYAPIIARPVIEVVGHKPLPEPVSLSLQALVSGTSDGGWVQVAGIVRSVRQLPGQHFFKLAIGDHGVNMEFPVNLDTSELQSRLLDSQVRVNAVCGTIFNEKRQLIGIRFFVPDLASVKIEEPAPSQSASVVRPIVTLLRFDPLNISAHRVRVRGVVTLRDGKGNFYAQDSSAGIYVVPEPTAQLTPGQAVEVFGFPMAGPEGPYLDDATVETSTTVSPVVPVHLTADDSSAGLYNSQLVMLQGRLLDQLETPDRDVMILQSGSMVFRSSVPRGRLPSGVRRGSLLELTGVLQSEGPAGQALYRLALRSAADVRVLKAASWWTPEHSVRVSIGVTLVILIALLWVVANGYRTRSYQATRDPLTGLQNRRTTLEYLERQMARAIREQSSVAVVLANVDHFKKLNEAYGHLAGDAVLKRIAVLLSADLRPYDAAGRYGGGDFLVVLPGCDSAMAREVAERIRFRVQQEWFASFIPAEALPVTCSCGIAIANDTSWSVDSLLTSASCALYDAKNTGRNRTVVANLTPARTLGKHGREAASELDD